MIPLFPLNTKVVELEPGQTEAPPEMVPPIETASIVITPDKL